MEIARLEVSTQQHLERMQETAKVNYVQYGKSTKSKKKKPQSSAGATSQGASRHKGAGGHRGSRPGGKPNKRPPLLSDTCYRCGKGRHQKAQDCKAVDATCRGCERKDIMRKFAYKENALHTLWRHHRPIQQGLGPVNPYISMMRDNQSTLTWSVSPMQTNI